MDLIKNSLFRSEFFDYNSFCESRLLKQVGETCYKCNKEKKCLTPLDPDFYYLPCWNCSSTNEIDRKALTDCIIKNINVYYNKFVNDRYLQLFILDDIYYKNTLPHSYSEFKNVLNSLEIPDKNSFWFLDWKLGYPKTINLQNLDGFKIVNISHLYKIENLENKEISVNDIKIEKPLLIPYDAKHYFKNSIFNLIKTNRTKKIKISSENCYKFFNTGNGSIRSIFNLIEGEEKVYFNNLSVQDFTILKLSVLRNKTYLKIIQEVVNALITDDRVAVFRDTIFLKNDIRLRPLDEEGLIVNLIWNSKENAILNDNCINISIF